MSGGSYNYLCDAFDLDDLIAKQASLREMADRLAGLDDAKDAAMETEQLLVMLQQWEVRARVRVDRLREVWKAVEWADSGDRSEGSIQEALATYRGEPAGKVLHPDEVTIVLNDDGTPHAYIVDDTPG